MVWTKELIIIALVKLKNWNWKRNFKSVATKHAKATEMDYSNFCHMYMDVHSELPEVN